MTEILSGIRVLEVASWTFVPAAGAILADWGADVGRHDERPPAPRLDLGRHSLQVLPPTAGDDHVGAVLREHQRGRPPDAGAAPGDERDLAGEVEHRLGVHDQHRRADRRRDAAARAPLMPHSRHRRGVR